MKRNTRFHTNYVVNLLFGKEWTPGSKKNKILGVNGRLNLLGGQRMTPIDRGSVRVVVPSVSYKIEF